jgi:hypothetical protein
MRTTCQASKFALAILASWLVLGAETRSKAALVIQTPAGLAAGDTFRIVFVTDGTTNATSPDISSYDAFVTAQAGGATYKGMTVNWQAIGSTANDNAVVHVGSSTAGVFLASGTEVATSTTADPGGLWSGTLLNPIDQDLTGTTLIEQVWTGTAKSTPFGHTSVNPLGGNVGQAKPGDAGATDSNWIANTIFGADDTLKYAMYGISQELTVPQVPSAPEPSSLWMAGVGTLAGIAYGRSRKRRQEQKRQGPMGQTAAAA